MSNINLLLYYLLVMHGSHSVFTLKRLVNISLWNCHSDWNLQIYGSIVNEVVRLSIFGCCTIPKYL